MGFLKPKGAAVIMATHLIFILFFLFYELCPEEYKKTKQNKTKQNLGYANTSNKNVTIL